jgi:Right handed beta helix region
LPIDFALANVPANGFAARWSRAMRRQRRSWQLCCFACLFAVLVALPPARALATVYRVGPDQALKRPSQAARIVAPGDTVQIEPMPGGYYDCAIWRADDLTIEGIGNDVRLTDMTCQRKAIFITIGNRITIRNLTFARARVPDRNGAGIRAEGADLSIERSRFIDNESGILAADSAASRIAIRDSQFTANGTCGPRHCTDAIAVGHIAELTVAHCVISGTKGGDAIRSQATHTHLVADRIEDGATGSAAFLVELPDGGSLDMENNTLERGPLPSDPSVAVRIMQGAGARPVDTLVFTGNTVRNDTHAPLAFVLNWTGTTARMENNHMSQDVTPVSSSGYLWFLTKSSIHRSLAAAKALARAIRRHL